MSTKNEVEGVLQIDDSIKEHINVIKNDLAKFEIVKQELDLDTSIVDKIIDEIDFTGYHIFLFILMNIYLGGEGFIMIGNSLLIPVLSQLWDLSEWEKGLLGGSIFLGFTLGALVSGLISDTLGRRLAFIIGLLISTGGTLLALFDINFLILGISNILNGFGIGISIPAVFSLCSELSGGRIRNITINISFMAFTAGEIICCYIARSEEIYKLENDSWKSLIYFRLAGVNK